MVSPSHAEFAWGTSASANAVALTTVEGQVRISKRIPSCCPSPPTKVVDRKLVLAITSLVEHFSKFHHSVYTGIPPPSGKDQLSQSTTENPVVIHIPMLISTVK
jgi:hypothetical protein